MSNIHNSHWNLLHSEASSKAKTKEYSTWTEMRSRCNNPKSKSYSYYGGRGITVCPRWNSYVSFLDDMGMAPTRQHTLDRLDVNKDYSPENCRWTTRLEQANNKTTTHFVEFNGQIKSLSDWCRDLGMSYYKVRQRLLKLNWPVDQAFQD